MKKIAVIGTRRRDTYADFCMTEKCFLSVYEEGDTIVSGGCKKGGDRFAELLITKYNTGKEIHKAEWVKGGVYDRSAGHKRNTIVARVSDVVVACVASDRTGGTEDTIRKFVKFHPRGELRLC